MGCQVCGIGDHTPDACGLLKHMTGVRYDAEFERLEWSICTEHDTWSASAFGPCSACLGGEPIPLVCKGALFYRTLPGGEFAACVYSMMFGKARLCRAEVDEIGYDLGYCYQSVDRAIEAARVWSGDGDPLDGWHREVSSGRRRENGDPNKETRG